MLRSILLRLVLGSLFLGSFLAGSLAEASTEKTKTTECRYEAGDVGRISSKGTYEDAFDKVATQCLARRTEILSKRKDHLSSEDFKERQILFLDECVNQTKCTET